MAYPLINTAVLPSGGQTGPGTFNSGAFDCQAGKTVLVLVRYFTGDGPSGATDTALNNYVEIGRIENASHETLVMYKAYNTNANAANVVAVAFGTGLYIWGTVAQFDGLITTNPLDTYSTSTQTGTSSLTSGAYTTAQASELLIFGLGSAAGGNTFSDSGWIVAVVDADGVEGMLYKVVSSIQTAQTETATQTTSSGGETILAAFKIAAAGFTLSADSGTFALTGTDVGLNVGNRALNIGSGTFALTGSAISFDYLVQGDSGVFVLTGSPLTLTYGSAGATDYPLTVGSGTFVLTGSAITLVYAAKSLVLGSGSFHLNGTSLSILYSNASCRDKANGIYVDGLLCRRRRRY